MFFALGRQFYQLGLDIQVDGIRLIKLRKTKHKHTLEQTAFTPLLPLTVTESGVKRWDEVQAALTPLVAMHGCHGLPVCICLPADMVRMQSITLPSELSDIEIETEIMMCLQREQPGLQDPLAIDFVKTHSNQTEYMKVYFSAVREKYVANYIACINASGLDVKVVDIDAYAIQRVILSHTAANKVDDSLSITICLRGQDKMLTIFDEQKMIFHQRCYAQDDYVMQIMQGIKLVTVSRSIVSVTICGAEQESKEMSARIQDEWQCKTIYWQTQDVFQHCTTDWLAAFGAAMREMPAW